MLSGGPEGNTVGLIVQGQVIDTEEPHVGEGDDTQALETLLTVISSLLQEGQITPEQAAQQRSAAMATFLDVFGSMPSESSQGAAAAPATAAASSSSSQGEAASSEGTRQLEVLLRTVELNMASGQITLEEAREQRMAALRAYVGRASAQDADMTPTDRLDQKQFET